MKSIFAVLLPLLLVSCILSPRIESVKGAAGRFVEVKLENSSNGYFEVSFDDSIVATGTLSDGSLEFFAPEPGIYRVNVRGHSFEVSVQPPKWLVLVWMVADNNLQNFVRGDLEEMERAGDDVSVVVALDSSSDVILALSSNGFRAVEETRMNGGSGKEFGEFLEKYGMNGKVKTFLIVWNHGSAWLRDSVYRAVGFDEESKDALTIREIADSMPFKVDIIGFDACFMGSVEVAYELRDRASYMVASGDYESSEGWNYAFLENMKENPLDVAKDVVDAYAEEYSNLKTQRSLVALDLSKITDVALSVTELTLDVDPEEIAELSSKLQDEDDYRKFLKDASKVLAIYEPALKALEEFIVYGWGSAQRLNIFLPNPGLLNDVIKDYLRVSFGKDTGWLNLLKEAGL